MKKFKNIIFHAVAAVKNVIYNFMTKNGLFGEWKKYSASFATDKWWGYCDKSYKEEIVLDILDKFNNDREHFFELFHSSTYKDTYISDKFLPNATIYLKHYRVFDAEYKKSEIIKRNLFRRNLAKKAYNLYYTLKKRGIRSVEPLFYAGVQGSFISKEAILVTIGTSETITLKTYLARLDPLKNSISDYSEEYFQSLKVSGEKEKIENLLGGFGKFVKKLHQEGVIIWHKELLANTLIEENENRWEYMLCDLDTIKCIGEISDLWAQKDTKRLDYRLRKVLKNAAEKYTTEKFLQSVNQEKE